MDTDGTGLAVLVSELDRAVDPTPFGSLPNNEAEHSCPIPSSEEGVYLGSVKDV